MWYYKPCVNEHWYDDVFFAIHPETALLAAGSGNRRPANIGLFLWLRHGQGAGLAKREAAKHSARSCAVARLLLLLRRG
jgi:hypothetical protein